MYSICCLTVTESDCILLYKHNRFGCRSFFEIPGALMWSLVTWGLVFCACEICILASALLCTITDTPEFTMGRMREFCTCRHWGVKSYWLWSVYLIESAVVFVKPHTVNRIRVIVVKSSRSLWLMSAIFSSSCLIEFVVYVFFWVELTMATIIASCQFQWLNWS